MWAVYSGALWKRASDTSSARAEPLRYIKAVTATGLRCSE